MQQEHELLVENDIDYLELHDRELCGVYMGYSVIIRSVSFPDRKRYIAICCTAGGRDIRAGKYLLNDDNVVVLVKILEREILLDSRDAFDWLVYKCLLIILLMLVGGLVSL